MFQPWRLKLREAQDAFRQGRLEEAGRLLAETGLHEFRPAKELLSKVAESGVQEAERCLAVGDPQAALGWLDQLDRRHAQSGAARALREAAARLAAAQRLARRGDLARAEAEYSRAAARVPHIAALADAARECSLKRTASRDHLDGLYKGLACQHWSDVLTHAEALIELCPDHEIARQALRRAWSAVGVPLMEESTNTFVQKPASSKDSPQPAERPPIDRFLLWVDGVGGYLVCSTDEVTLGQPVAESPVDIPILGDLSRRHAKIRRDGENYLIEPRRPVRLNGRTIDRAAALTDGAMLELGNVLLRFRQPHPLSATARLEFVSRHRTLPSADAILLLAESCVLGPSAQSHVVCGDWSRELILYRQGDDLFGRRTGPFQVDGQPVVDYGKLTLKSHLSGEDFSLSVESLVG
ncbi:MAG TPA: FHA domain-containing protein [Pirellulales bacterium]|nr:FHA domain-containing protein [Pirellulales bacterium]